MNKLRCVTARRAASASSERTRKTSSESETEEREGGGRATARITAVGAARLGGWAARSVVAPDRGGVYVDSGPQTSLCSQLTKLGPRHGMMGGSRATGPGASVAAPPQRSGDADCVSPLLEGDVGGDAASVCRRGFARSRCHRRSASTRVRPASTFICVVRRSFAPCANMQRSSYSQAPVAAKVSHSCVLYRAARMGRLRVGIPTRPHATEAKARCQGALYDPQSTITMHTAARAAMHERVVARHSPWASRAKQCVGRSGPRTRRFWE